MMLRNSTAVLVVLAGTTLWGQSSTGSLVHGRQPVMATSNAESLAATTRARTASNQQLQDMGITLAKMHALLKQMQTNTPGSRAKDPMAKANFDMWALMLEQLDKQYEQLRVAVRSREDLEARRAALYKQADEKAAAAAKSAAAAAKAAPAVSNATSQPPAVPAAVQTPVTPASSTSPN